MLKIGEFLKLSMLTIKALRFYETAQLKTAATIKALRQLDLSVGEIKSYLNGTPLKEILQTKEAELKQKYADITVQLSIIKYLSEDKEMKYQAVTKMGTGNERIQFRILPATKAICT